MPKKKRRSTLIQYSSYTSFYAAANRIKKGIPVLVEFTHLWKLNSSLLDGAMPLLFSFLRVSCKKLAAVIQ
jgi:hypothetical protein